MKVPSISLMGAFVDGDFKHPRRLHYCSTFGSGCQPIGRQVPRYGPRRLTPWACSQLKGYTRWLYEDGGYQEIPGDSDQAGDIQMPVPPEDRKLKKEEVE